MSTLVGVILLASAGSAQAATAAGLTLDSYTIHDNAGNAIEPATPLMVGREYIIEASYRVTTSLDVTLELYTECGTVGRERWTVLTPQYEGFPPGSLASALPTMPFRMEQGAFRVQLKCVILGSATISEGAEGFELHKAAEEFPLIAVRTNPQTLIRDVSVLRTVHDDEVAAAYEAIEAAEARHEALAAASFVSDSLLEKNERILGGARALLLAGRTDQAMSTGSAVVGPEDITDTAGWIVAVYVLGGALVLSLLIGGRFTAKFHRGHATLTRMTPALKQLDRDRENHPPEAWGPAVNRVLVAWKRDAPKRSEQDPAPASERRRSIS